MIRAIVTSFALSFMLVATPGGARPDESDPMARTTETLLTSTSLARLSFAEKKLAFDEHVQQVYHSAGLQKAGLSYSVFERAYTGYHNFKQEALTATDKQILTVVDFTKPSNLKRMWIIDLDANKVLYNNLVAHGRNTGNVRAEKFSNEPNSNMSSMGFYLTNKTYYGKHGLSLRLSGMDEQYNSNAMERAIVLHGADYVSDNFVKQYGRLGRSLGCPAVPRAISADVIELIKDNTVLYIHSADKAYTSDYLNTERAVEGFAALQDALPLNT
ncbi:murein L,D-transpeptidase catalytic domain family protein [Pontibacter sp. HSC-14F20]|uniref:murein L,D-transpeptidase catalytic domain family protein n=1 Tax=Pontibacter sp. HSC-14F20 TaxID=2864136 RepID=UPI001C739DC1|nr:murein L,D-transpeptidase catalytic domain family protein [Pontibacter sp. HSC-14F20]MBX0335445.1 murein L,D-transpeptidase catalytic domain family protein [Pontibacter sp. HSC-14F20]